MSEYILQSRLKKHTVTNLTSRHTPEETHATKKRINA